MTPFVVSRLVGDGPRAAGPASSLSLPSGPAGGGGSPGQPVPQPRGPPDAGRTLGAPTPGERGPQTPGRRETPHSSGSQLTAGSQGYPTPQLRQCPGPSWGGPQGFTSFIYKMSYVSTKLFPLWIKVIKNYTEKKSDQSWAPVFLVLIHGLFLL